VLIRVDYLIEKYFIPLPVLFYTYIFMNLAIKQLKEKILNSENILVVGHENPDGDTVGSVLGFSLLLKKMNKNCSVAFPNDAPDFLKWLPTYNESIIATSNYEKLSKILKDCELIIGLDFNEKARAANIFQLIQNLNIVKSIIDHHPFPEPFFDIIISEQNVSSTAELVYHFIENCNWTNLIDYDIATCIFTGILTDTLSFNVNAFRPKTFEISAKLLSYGINKDIIHQNIFDSYTEQRMRLLGYALHKKMKIIHEWSAGYIYLTKEELKEFCFQKGDSEGLVNYPLSIKGIRIAALFLERENYIKISIRSKGDVPANEIMMKYFKGGGHLNAAGGEEYNLSLEETIKKFEQILPLYKKYLQLK